MLNRNERVYFPFGIHFIAVGMFGVLRFTLPYMVNYEPARTGNEYWGMFVMCTIFCYAALYFPIITINSLLAREREDRYVLIFGIILIPVSVGLECLIRVSTTLFTQGFFSTFVLLFGFLITIKERR